MICHEQITNLPLQITASHEKLVWLTIKPNQTNYLCCNSNSPCSTLASGKPHLPSLNVFPKLAQLRKAALLYACF